jgi:hypothetical protein
MTKRFWIKLDAFLFRIAGAVLGLSGCLGLALNNRIEVLFKSSYGVMFFLIFALLGSYSIISIIKEMFRPAGSDSKEAEGNL